jgi:uncharacterized protein YggU (UPF0235/DUF167 family)
MIRRISVKLLSKFFDIPKSMVIIARGEKSRDKVIDIWDEKVEAKAK